MTAQPLPVERDDRGEHEGVLTIRLEQVDRPIIVLDHALIQRLEATLATIPVDARAVVLASASERAFVAGADLKAISDLSDEQLDRYLDYGQRVFGILSQLPCPTVAAINGAALGGGLELAMHCDGLVASPSPSGKPYQVGLPEASLGLCPGWGGTNLLPARMDPADAIRRTATGRTMAFDEAAEAGLFDDVAATPDELLDAAKSWVCAQKTPKRDAAPARWIGRSETAPAVLAAADEVRGEVGSSLPGKAVLDAVAAGTARGWQAALDAERQRLVALRRTPAAVEAIRAFFERTAKKG